MGQYYKAVLGHMQDNPEPDRSAFVIDTYVHPHDFNNGLKLMEHSYVGNEVLNRVEKEIAHKPTNVVWAGDYGHAEPGESGNLYELCNRPGVQRLLPQREAPPMEPVGEDRAEGVVLLVNHTKGQFCRIPELAADSYDLVIHPLPILTWESGEESLGDFHNMDARVGSWARDVISTEGASYSPDGLEEISGEFRE